MKRIISRGLCCFLVFCIVFSAAFSVCLAPLPYLALSEERKAMAIALEQEMKAKTQEMRAVVLAAESEVPKAMAYAFREGKLGIMDYYRMQNVVADTAMRNSIAGNDTTKK